MTFQMPGDDQRREVVTLPLEYLNGWLFAIQADRVKKEFRDRALTYQRECYQALFRHFYPVQPTQPRITMEMLRELIRDELRNYTDVVGGVVRGIVALRFRTLNGLIALTTKSAL